MKNEILDAPLHHSFSDFLKKGETITWEGQPSLVTAFGNDDKLDDYELYRFISMFFIGAIFFLLATDIPYHVFILSFGLFFLLFFLTIILPKWNRKNKRNFSYAITQKQILFQMKEKWKRSHMVYSIPFSKIKNIIIVKTFDIENMMAEYENASHDPPAFLNKEGIEKIGTIFIVPHHPQLINFETVDVINNDKRHQPTLELLEDVDAIAKIIQEGIKNANTQL